LHQQFHIPKSTRANSLSICGRHYGQLLGTESDSRVGDVVHVW